MKHEEIRHKLSEYIDDGVTPEERAAIDEHLTTCTICADVLVELRKTIEQVKRIEEVEAPAWMTQKIMANVRVEAEKKKGLFHRLFYPLAIKLPIQALGVLFLTVTVYSIYNSMHPAAKYAEAPLGRVPEQEAPVKEQEAAKDRALQVPVEQEKQVSQEPGYKSLDMKYSYEKPAPPVPATPGAGTVAAREKPAVSAPAIGVAPMMAKDETASEATSAAPRAAAPSRMAEQGEPKQEPARDVERADGTAKALPTAGREADDTLAVTEHFVRSDLPERMKVKGLRFSTRKIGDDTPGLQWLREMTAYRTAACANRFLVDVDLSGRSYKYLYCYDRAGIRLLGVFELAAGVADKERPRPK